MKFNLNYEGFKEHLVRKNTRCGGIQYLFRFDNDQGASVVKQIGSYGNSNDQWELAVIYWHGDDYDIDYSTDITEDVIGWLSDEDVRDLLKQIKEL